jgi:hypothetical protein
MQNQSYSTAQINRNNMEAGAIYGNAKEKQTKRWKAKLSQFHAQRPNNTLQRVKR